MTEKTNLQALGSTAVLGADLERELRAAINPLYEDVRGTESYERKLLLGEVDRLRWRIAEIGDAMRTKAINNPNGVKASTLELLANDLLSVLPVPNF